MRKFRRESQEGESGGGGSSTQESTHTHASGIAFPPKKPNPDKVARRGRNVPATPPAPFVRSQQAYIDEGPTAEERAQVRGWGVYCYDLVIRLTSVFRLALSAKIRRPSYNRSEVLCYRGNL